MKLADFFQVNPKLALAFSGGVDSAYLLYAGLAHGADIKPYYIKTAFQPQFELDDALHLAKDLAVELTILQEDILASSLITANLPNRCYYCKSAIFSRLQKQAIADGYPLLIDGTNASDKADDRPGIQALKEIGVRSPLREFGIGKEEIRRLSQEAGLFTWNKPAYACLATRIPTGELITGELLTAIEKAEEQLLALGFADFRVRVYCEAARLQFSAEQMAKACQERKEILRLLRPYFKLILLDLEER